jgi:hypothetical protein
MWSNPLVLWLLLALFAYVSACANNPTQRCGAAGDCTHNQICYRGFCVAGVIDAASGSDGGMCAPGQTPCGRDCFSLESDDEHCGACDMHCPHDQSCSFGHCDGS